MACKLYTENDISALYTIVHGEITDRINNPKLGKFDNKALEKFIKEIYEEFKDEPNGLLYVQSIPDMLDIVKNDLEIKKYLLNEAGLDLTAVAKLSLDFEDLDNVTKYVIPPINVPKPNEIKRKVRKGNKSSKDVTQNNSNQSVWSALEKEDKAKPAFPDNLTGQRSAAVNPEKVSEEEKNKIDPEKELFDKVIKTAIYAARNKNENDEIIIGDTAVMLRAQSIRSLDKSDLTSDDRTFLANNKTYDINVAIISDETGEPLRFDDNGNITETGGKIVYQYIRPVSRYQGKLVLGNRSGYYYTLVSARTLANREIAAGEKNGEIYTKADRDAIFNKILNKQKQKMNDLERLNQRLADSSEYAMLPITGGSYGIVTHKSELLSKTKFADDVNMIYIHDSGPNEGDSFFMVNRVSSGVSVDTPIYLQRMDVDDQIAEKISKVLTSKGLLNGEELNPQLRLTYYNNFLSNRTFKNNIKVELGEPVLGQNSLKVTLIDPVSKEVQLVDLEADNAQEIIKAHLLKSNVIVKKDGTQISYPASMSYMKNFAVDGVIQKGERFTDYNFLTRANGVEVITETKKDYFNFIKPYMKVDYTTDDAAYFVGHNSYLSFATPEDLITPIDEQIDLGISNTKDSDIDDGEVGPKTKGKKSAPVKEKDEESGKNFNLDDVKTTTLDNQKLLVANINKSDVVLGLDANPNVGDTSKIKDRAKDKFYGLSIGDKKSAPKNLMPSDDSMQSLARQLASISPSGVMNIVGNDIAQLKSKGYTQKDIDTYIYNILNKLNANYPINEIITNGQTGIAEAAIKAAKKLDIKVSIRAFKSYQLNVPSPKLKSGYVTLKNNKANFIKRFVSTSSKAYQKANEIPEASVDETLNVEKAPIVETKTLEEQKKADLKINKTPIDNLLGSTDSIFDVPLERNKRAAQVMNQIYGSATTWNEVDKWWDNSPLKALTKVERAQLATVFNSTAYGTFLTSGAMLSSVMDDLRREGFVAKIKLYGDALPITLYHEAWHAFSQLVLTIDEKTKLYDEIRTYDKWANKEYIEIEEELAEDFIDYAVNNKKQKGFIQKIFDKIKKLLSFFFKNTTPKDVARLQDIPNVKMYFEKLYTGNFKIDTLNAEKNIMRGFERLNSAKNTIQPLKTEAKDFSEFTDAESNKVNNLLDSLMARTFYQYNSKFNTTAGAVKLLDNINSREQLYNNLKKQLDVLLENQYQVYENIVRENIDSENPDYITENKELSKLELLKKTVDNYGNIGLSLAKKTKAGVVAFHMQRSRFSVLKESYVDDIEDATTALFKTTEGNAISSRQLASDDTTMMLSGIYKLERDNKGNYVKRENEDGVEEYIVKTDEFGAPELEPVNDMWNRLARILQGSLDYIDMWNKLRSATDNYPEILQILEVLPNPNQFGPAAYNNKTEFQSETNFWQDLKKPVIPYIQFNINKTTLEKAKKVDGVYTPAVVKYESRLAAANFDIFRIVNDWTTNFNISDSTINKYIIKDEFENNYLDTTAIMRDFSYEGKLKSELAVDFLAALGIQLDLTSAEIRKIVNDKQKPFAAKYNINFIFNNIRLVHLAGKAKDLGLNAAAEQVKRQPLTYLLNGLPESIEKAAGGKARDVRSKITAIAQLQNRFSDGYSNYSVLTPEKSKVWEQFVDNTVTRIITSINTAKNWQELTTDEADPNGRFQHMRWLAEANNPSSQFSVILNSIFDLDTMSDTYGEKLTDGLITLENIGGTQIIDKETNRSTGVSTASTDVTSKFLQEFHTMLQSGVQEFMRHASKQTAMNMRAEKIKTYDGKKQDNLYVDIMAFSPTNTVADNNLGESQAFNIILGYIAAEAGRIYRFKSDKPYFEKFSSYNRNVIRKDNGATVKAGEAFTAFDDVLSPDTQAKLYALIDESIEDDQNEILRSGYYNIEGFDFKTMINENPSLRKLVKADVIEYFNKQSTLNYNRLENANYVDNSLYELVTTDSFNKSQVDKMLIKAYTYNSWIHNYETIILAYGDLVQYNHDKEEFHKRNAGLGSGGKGFRSDFRSRMYINGPLYQNLYAQKNNYTVDPYNGTLNSAIIKELVIDKSEYYDEYYTNHVASYTDRFIKAGKSKAEAKRLAEDLAKTVLKDYNKMKIADGQGWLNFEAYRMLKNLEGNWSNAQENLYKRIVAGEIISASQIKEFFPPYKLQYYGNIKTKGLPLTSFHKFSLAPIIPTVHTPETQLGQIHDMMLKQNVHYVLMETGEKVGHLGEGDVILDENGNINTSVDFTKNVIFTEFLKNQTEVNSKYKGVNIFSTQLRKMVLEGLYEQGEIDTLDETKITNKKITDYIDRVSEYTELLKNQLVDQLGFAEEDGEYVPKEKDSLVRLTKMIRETLTKDDIYSDDLIDIIDVTDSGELRFDLSLHPEAAKIEKLLLSVINKRIIKQKVKGEPLVQKSSGFYDGLFELPIDTDKMGKAARDAAVKKYMGSNFLPTYHKKIIDLDAQYKDTDKEKLEEELKSNERLLEQQSAYWTDRKKQALRDEIQYLKDKIAGRKPKFTTTTDGFTAAMKVAIALQGDYENLLNLEYKGEPIGDIDRLNEAIKDDEWLDADNGANRKAITMVGVRIPVQGLNSMEFMEIYHFLPPQAGNIIIPPAEIVAKSGADFDIDKLSIFMNNIDAEGRVMQTLFDNAEDFYAALKNPEEYGLTKEQMYELQKAGLENLLLNDLKNILELPENYVSLTTPNGTYLVKPIADELSEYVMEYDPYSNMMSEESNKTAPDEEGKQKKVISPTRVLEVGYNLYKHESNVVGKKTLGLGAIENTFNVVFNSLGATMPAVYNHSNEENPRIAFLALRHNERNVGGENLISLSHRYDVDGINKVADVISQLMNGWVDVEKDPWVFFVQGNYEVAPILMYLLKTGVPFKEAAYFVSQPLVREYVAQKRLSQSTYAEPLRQTPGEQGVSYKAASDIIGKYFPEFISGDEARYNIGLKTLDKYLNSKDRAADERFLTADEMLNLIIDSKNDSKEKSSLLSQAMFLHYLTLEQQIQGLTQLKLTSNPDTKTMTDIGQAIQEEANMESLAEETKISQELRIAMIEDSIISSFFNTKLVKGLGKPLFKFRYDDDIQDYVQSYMSDFKNVQYLRQAFGNRYRDLFPVVFRNDILSYLFQNALRKYSLDNQYNSYGLEESIGLQPAQGLKFGAYVAETKDGPKLIYDRVQIEKEFYDKAYLEGSDANNSYADRSLYPLKAGHFEANISSNKDEYVRFVIEREFIRHNMPFEEVVKTENFQKELKAYEKTSLSTDKTKNRRFVYEKIIAMQALDNTLNPYHLFRDKENSYSIRLNKIKNEYKNDFVKDYPILSRMVPDSNSEKTMFNFYIDDKDMNTFKSNLYAGNLKDLADKTVMKVEDKSENDRISNFFSMITFVSMLQSGTNKSKYNFLNLTDFEKFITVMNDETSKFLESPSKIEMLIDFKNRFEIVNSNQNFDRYRFKNYLTSLDVQRSESQVSTAVDLKQITPKVNIVDYRTMTDEDKINAYDNNNEDAQKRWLEEEIGEFYEAIYQYNNNLDTFSSKGVNKGKATMDDVIDETLGIFRTAQIFPKFSDLIIPYLSDLKIALNSFDRKEGYAIYKAKKDAKNQAKDMTYENLFEFVDKYITQPTEDDFGFIGFKLSVDKRGKDQGKASLANHFIGYGAKGTSTYQYEQDAKKAGIGINYDRVLDEFTIAFVSVNGNNKATEKAIFETIENAREVLENGGTVIMDSTADANRSWNKSGEALVQEGLGEPSGQTSKGYNYWGPTPEWFARTLPAEVGTTSENLVKRKNLIATTNPNMFIYNDLSGTDKAYEFITKNNPDVTFIYQLSLGAQETYDKMTPQQFNNQKLKGQVILKKLANNSSVGIITGQNSVKDSFSKLDPKNYKLVKANIEKSIAQINQVIQDGGKVAFSINGYGDPVSMPQELFVYLSKRLFEEFQYLNPGSEFTQEVSKEVAKYQPITDAEILAKFTEENDPLKC